MERAGVVRNLTRGGLVARRLFVARRPLERALGLLARPPLRPGEALWLLPCGSVHTWGMRYPIDLLFLDAGLRVLAVCRAVPPGRIVFAPRGTRSVLELSAAALEGAPVEPGDRLAVVESDDGSMDPAAMRKPEAGRRT